MKTKTTFKQKKLLIAGLSLALIAAAAGTFYFTRPDSKPASTTDRQPTINYGPATKAEKKEAEDNKDRIVKEGEAAQAAPPQASGKKSVTPVITNTNGSVNAYVPGVFEESGNCVATFIKGSTTLSASSAGFQNVSNTQCAPIDLPTGLTAGTWTVTLNYTSSVSEGVSAKQTLEVN